MKLIKVQILILSMLLSISMMAQKNVKYSGFSLSVTEWRNNFPRETFETKYENWSGFGDYFTLDLSDYEMQKNESKIHPSYFSLDITGHLSFRNNRFGLPGKFQGLNIGLNFINTLGSKYVFSTQGTKGSDSIQSGVDLLIVDSNFTRQVTYSETRDLIAAFIQYEFTTNPARRFSLYGGPQISAGIYHNHRIWVDDKITRYNSRYLNSRDNLVEQRALYTYYPNNTFASHAQVESLPNMWEISALLPVGVRFKLADTDNFLDLIYLFVEGQLGYAYRIESRQHAGLQNISVGLRFWEYPFN